MVGTRRHVYGTIYSRVQGMLKSNTISQSDKPIWYHVYEKYPPKFNANFFCKSQNFTNSQPEIIVPEITFPQDEERWRIQLNLKEKIFNDLFSSKRNKIDKLLENGSNK